MLERLGTVIYWTGILGALGWGAFWAVMMWAAYNPAPGPFPWKEALFVAALVLVPMALIYMAGWAVRYVLTGRR